MLKLNVGISRKVGLPGYSSAGASCHIEVELPSEILHDPEKFREHVQGAYARANQAVSDELIRLRSRPDSVNGQVRHGTNSSVGGELDDDRAGEHVSPSEGATTRQIRAIEALARSRSADLQAFLLDGHGVGRPEDLSSAEAAALIRRLNALAEDHGVRPEYVSNR